MKKSVRKSALLFTSTMALAAFAMPAAASALAWGPINTTGALDGQVSTQNAGLNYGFTCDQHLALHTRVPASATMDVTSVTYSNCVGQFGISSCTVTPVAQGLPWTVNALSTNNVRIVGFNVTVTLSGAAPCPGYLLSWGPNSPGVGATVASGVWNATTHSVAYASATGLKFDYTYGAPYNGTLRNPTQNLTLS